MSHPCERRRVNRCGERFSGRAAGGKCVGETGKCGQGPCAAGTAEKEPERENRREQSGVRHGLHRGARRAGTVARARAGSLAHCRCTRKR